MIKRVVLPGFVASLVILVAGIGVSLLFSAALPSLNEEYQNATIFRPASDPLMLLYFVHPFALGFILAWVWDKTKIVWSNEQTWRNSLNFALCYWLISVAGMLITYGTFQLSIAIVVSWTTSTLIQAVLAGFVFSKMNPF